jgi:N-acylneuraminate cytidylyltransferase
VSAPRVVAVIPARGGSKGLPRKNLRPLGGHPLLAWSIAAGRASAAVDAVIVSTDDEEIAATARACGAEVPFLRPHELARDDTPDLPVFEHALGWLAAEHGRAPEILVQLRPTSPLRPSGLVDEALALLRSHPEADSLRAVTSPSQTPYKMWRLRGSFLAPLLGSMDEELFNSPRQRLPALYWQTGHLDLVRASTILELRSMTGRNVLAFPVDPRYALDIDSLDQLELAEWLLARAALDVVRPSGARRCA